TWAHPSEMVRADSRLTLIVTETRTMRLQEITPEDCAAEGVILPLAEEATAARRQWEETARQRFIALWTIMYAVSGPKWDDNPDVLAITFIPYKFNIDAMGKEIVADG
ncbi:hypothetical protein LCGC14_1624430, partial [marine sediment metagenome]